MNLNDLNPEARERLRAALEEHDRKRLSRRTVRTPVDRPEEHDEAVNAILEPLTAPGSIARPPTDEIVDGHFVTVIWVVNSQI